MLASDIRRLSRVGSVSTMGVDGSHSTIILVYLDAASSPELCRNQSERVGPRDGTCELLETRQVVVCKLCV